MALYEVVVFGETVMLAVVAFVFQVTVPEQPEAEIIVLAPTQIVVAVAVSVGGVGFGLTVISNWLLTSLTQPVAAVQMAVYFESTVGLTTSDVPVPVEEPPQVIVPAQAEAVSVVDFPTHIVVLDAEIVSGIGFGLTVNET